jgi:HAD superfamily hydrolase (TIGR01509 family)
MTLPRPLDAVILDMDGTLHDTEAVYIKALKQSVQTLGFSVSDEFCHSLIGIPGRECDAILQDHLGPSFRLADCNRLYIEHRDRLLAEAIPLKTGAAELLDFLVAEAIPVAIATSSSRRTAEAHLARSGLRSRLSVVVTRDDVERGKPFPDLFLAAAAELRVDPTRCLAVEDSLHGVRAAFDAGMMPIMVPDLLQPTADIRPMCIHVASNLHEVRQIAAKHWPQRVA